MINNLFLKILLFPFSLLYGIIIGARNLAYDAGLLKSVKFSLPVISIGNLAIGGAGKTPHVEYIIRMLYKNLDIAVLSRGYKRKTKGFLLVEYLSDVLSVGDEPLQYKRKYRDIIVAVSESRAIGIPQILHSYPDTQVVILDDAFQHRAVYPAINILLTEYSKPYTKDTLLPVGRLRESITAARRADVVVVTKCPYDIDVAPEAEWRTRLKLMENQLLLFSAYRYGEPYHMFSGQPISLNQLSRIVLVSAIANTTYLIEYLDSYELSINHLDYEDHHLFSDRDMDYMIKVFQNEVEENTIVLTTEKDAMRLSIHASRIKELNIPVYVLPIEVKFLMDGKMVFEDYIKNYLLRFRA